VSPPFITGTVDCSLGGAVERATIYVRWKVHKFTSSCDLRLRACSNGGTSCGQQDGRIVSFTTHCRYYMSLFIPPRTHRYPRRSATTRAPSRVEKDKAGAVQDRTRRFFFHPPLFPPLLLHRILLSITIRGFSSRGHCAVIRGGSHSAAE
jgi:hypothetical protein